MHGETVKFSETVVFSVRLPHLFPWGQFISRIDRKAFRY